MPYEIQKADGGYYVVTIGTGKRHSDQPLSKGQAEAQMRAMYSNMSPAEKKMMDKHDSSRMK